MNRDAQCIALVGINGSGKSVTCKRIIKEWKETNPSGEVWIYDPKNDFQDYADYSFRNNGDAHINKMLTVSVPILFVIDELRMLNEKNTVIKSFHNLFALRRSRSIDIIYNVHAPNLILEYLTNFTDYFFLFKTLSKKKNFSDKIPNSELLHEKSLIINKEVNNFGNGGYPNFKHIIVNSSGESENVNF